MNRRDVKLQRKGIMSKERAQLIEELLAPAMRFHKARQFASAISAYHDALSKEPDCADAWCNLSNALGEMCQHEGAIAAARRALELNPKMSDAHNNLASGFMQMGYAKEAFAEFREAANLKLFDWNFRRNLLAGSLYCDDLDAAAIGKLHKAVAGVFGKPGIARPKLREARWRTRIGFLSSDLRDHVVSNSLLPLVWALDPSKFDITFIGHDSAHDHISAKYRERADAWVNIDGVVDSVSADRIRAANLDMFVSLAGHLDRNRPTIASWRVAPIQVSMFDIATSGLPAMDYIVADEWTAPIGGPEWFAESVVRVNPIYVSAPPKHYPAPKDERDTSAVTFGCFNNPAKISPSCLRAWAEIMQREPRGQLVLGYKTVYAQKMARDRVLAAMPGVDPSRVTFLAYEVPEAGHLARYHKIDVALDTFPFSGSTTSFHALAMGVPLVTLPSDRMAGRWSYSMLKCAWFEGWIARDIADYINKAVTFGGHNPEDRAMQREQLMASPICNVEAYAANLAHALEEIAERAYA
jgi:protein O-GlcNAc transferase